MTRRSEEMDLIIETSLQKLAVEAESGMPDPGVAWTNFEHGLKQKRRHKIFGRIPRLALAATLTAAILLSSQSEKVTAFKNQVFVWVSQEAGKEKIIKEVENPGIEDGTYKGLTFEEAQEMVLFSLKKPGTIPEGMDPSPQIDIQVIEYPLVSVAMRFTGEDGKELFFQQENSTGNREESTFVAEDCNVEKMFIKGKEVLVITNENTFLAKWNDNGIWYELFTVGLERDEAGVTLNSLF